MIRKMNMHANDTQDGQQQPDGVELPDEITIADVREIHAAPPNSYREAGRRFLAFFDQSIAFISTYENPRLAALCVAHATGRSLITGGKSQQQIADELSLSRAAVNKCVKTVQSQLGSNICGISPMPGQRSVEACRHFAEVRVKQLSPPQKKP
jgi:hypothetical protein